MAIDGCTFIEPGIAEAGVHAHEQIVLAAVIQKVSQIEAERGVSIVIAPHERAVQEHQRIAKGPVELQHHAPAGIFFGDIKNSSIPSHAGFWIAATQRLVAMPLQFFVANKRQLDCPVVRQVERSPFGVVELLSGKLELASFGEVSLAHAKSQIAPRIAAMSLKKFPAEVEQQTLPRS